MSAEPPAAPAFHQHPYAGFLHEIEKPARYVGGEFGQVRKRWEQVSARVCLAFPDLYDIGMSHLGTRILYSELNAQPDLLCERAFAPWHDMEKQLRARQLPLLSLESARPLGDFDVVGISLQHELVFSNVLTLLALGGIPLRACDRTDAAPLVLGGGSIATHPEPMAPFFDAFVVGDGERKAAEVARCWAAERGQPRAERLRKLAALGGVYVPSLYSTRLEPRNAREVVEGPLHPGVPFPVRRAFVDDLDAFPFPEQFPVGGPEAVFERLSIEIARGCMQGCRFCQAGMIFRPQRDRDPVQLAELIERAVRWAGDDEVALTSLSTADYPFIGELIGELTGRLSACNVALGVSSLRAYGLSEQVFEALRKVRATGLTFAPEAGTQRMRDLINKNVTEEQILLTAERALRRGWDRLKFYFMIGLPTETEDDVAAIVETTARAREAGRRGRQKGRPVKLTASVSTFAPKPHTPLQWEKMSGPEEVLDKQRVLKDRARLRNVDLKVHALYGSILEGLLCRGDRRLADVIERAWSKGARFDAWEGAVSWDAWMAALAECGMELGPWLAELPLDAPLPWDHIDVGLEQSFLKRERERAMRGSLTPACGRPLHDQEQEGSTDKLVCVRCGVQCDLPEMASRRAGQKQRLATLRSRSAQAAAPPNDAVCVEPQAGPVPEVESAAKEPEGDAAIAATQAAPAAQGDVKEQPGRGAAVREPVRYRLRFEKLGKASLLGHLDLVRELPRVLQRAGLPLWYSQGFHPKAVMSFGPALSLGVPSFEEFADVKATEEVDAAQLLERLAQVSPEGLRFVQVQALARGAPAIGQVLQRAEYLLGLPCELQDRVRGSVQDRLWCTTVVRRSRDGAERAIDLAALVEQVQLGTEADREQLAAGGIAGSWFVLRASLRMGPSGTPRLQELADVLAGAQDTAFRAARVALKGAA
jgi:radical SAM family uncharacterized protein/radical SAM-linked protein